MRGGIVKRALLPLLLVLCANDDTTEPTFVTCKWQDGTYPSHILSNGPHGTYRIAASGFQSWRPSTWSWASFRCERELDGRGPCETKITDESYAFIDSYQVNDGLGRKRWTDKLTIDRLTGTATFYHRDYHYYGISGDGAKESTRTGSCEKASDPSRAPRPKARL